MLKMMRVEAMSKKVSACQILLCITYTEDLWENVCSDLCATETDL